MDMPSLLEEEEVDSEEEEEDDPEEEEEEDLPPISPPQRRLPLALTTLTRGGEDIFMHPVHEESEVYSEEEEEDDPEGVPISRTGLRRSEKDVSKARLERDQRAARRAAGPDTRKPQSPSGSDSESDSDSTESERVEECTCSSEHCDHCSCLECCAKVLATRIGNLKCCRKCNSFLYSSMYTLHFFVDIMFSSHHFNFYFYLGSPVTSPVGSENGNPRKMG